MSGGNLSKERGRGRAARLPAIFSRFILRQSSCEGQRERIVYLSRGMAPILAQFHPDNLHSPRSNRRRGRFYLCGDELAPLHPFIAHFCRISARSDPGILLSFRVTHDYSCRRPAYRSPLAVQPCGSLLTYPPCYYNFDTLL